MSQQSPIELEPTLAKLRLLEDSDQAARFDTSGTAHTQELELRSLKQLINQLKRRWLDLNRTQRLQLEEVLAVPRPA